MPTTSTFNFPYPSLTDAPNGPAQTQALAAALDTYLAGLPVTQHGTVTVHVTTNNAYTVLAVSFPTAFSATPSITVSALVTGTGAITEWGYDTPTASGFNIGVARTLAQDTVLSWGRSRTPMMTTVHIVRGLYLAVSIAVGVVAGVRGIRLMGRDGWAASALAAYAIATAAAQATAFNKPLTAGTGYVGVGVLGGACWLTVLAIESKRRKS